VGAGIWLLHPLFVSTTLYIVQREAILPTTFTLLGLLGYLRGRIDFATNPGRGMAWMIAGIVAGTAFALMCKANGILLPLLAWVIEACVLRRRLMPAPRWFVPLFLAIPTLVIIAYVFSRLTSLHTVIPSRGWTIAERLMTEPRVLLDYLHLLAVPRVLSTGLYNDGYTVSRTLLDPSTTLPAMLIVGAMLIVAIAVRRRAPALSCALLFFFAGHLLESSTIPLELYFEHRNYLPTLLLFWPLGRALAAWKVPPAIRALAVASLFGLCALTTWQRATLWGDPDRLTALWAQQNPASSRALATTAIHRMRAGDFASARALLDALGRERPYDLQIALNRVNALCGTGGLGPSDIRGVAEAFERSPGGGQLMHKWLSRAIEIAHSGVCPTLNDAVITAWLAAAQRNPIMARIAGRRQDLRSLSGRLALARGDHAGALLAFNQALDEAPSPDVAAMQAAWLATEGRYREALAHLDHYDAVCASNTTPHGWNMRRIHAWVLQRQGYWDREFAILRSKLDAELSRRAARTPTP
jgi:protein O-mannosyl-transferase